MYQSIALLLADMDELQNRLEKEGGSDELYAKIDELNFQYFSMKEKK